MENNSKAATENKEVTNAAAAKATASKETKEKSAATSKIDEKPDTKEAKKSETSKTAVAPTKGTSSTKVAADKETKETKDAALDNVAPANIIEEAPEEAPEGAPEEAYPQSFALTRRVSTFRGPSEHLQGKAFGGNVTVLSETDKFYQVSIVRAGFGQCTCYMLRQEVDACRS